MVCVKPTAGGRSLGRLKQCIKVYTAIGFCAGPDGDDQRLALMRDQDGQGIFAYLRSLLPDSFHQVQCLQDMSVPALEALMQESPRPKQSGISSEQ